MTHSRQTRSSHSGTVRVPLAGEFSHQRLTRRSVLGSGAGFAAAAALGWPSASAAAAGRIPLGGAIQSQYLDSDPRYADAFLEHYDLIMPMNELKFGMIQPGRDEWNFDPADRLIELAMSNGKLSRGHAHVWWGAMPEWVEAIDNEREAERVLIEHIERVTDRYKGKLMGWDVTNEVIAYDPREDGPLRDTYWLRMLGPRHIPLAFQTTARADPGANLVVNDYDLEFEGALYDARRAVTLDLVRQLQDGGVDVSGVGIQGHLYIGRPIDKAALERFHRALDEMGVELLVTELDVINLAGSSEPAIMDEEAYAIVADFLDGIFAWKPPSMVVVWGLTDRYTWVPGLLPRSDGAAHRPLPLDRDYEAKPWLSLLRSRLDAAS